MIGVEVAVKTEVGDRVHLVEVWTGEFEKVADHSVTVTGMREVREGVENEVMALALLSDYAVDFGNKVLETGIRVGPMDGDSLFLLKNGFMGAEPKVNDVISTGKLVLGEPSNKGNVVFYRIYSPEDIVSGIYTLNNSVQMQEPCGFHFLFTHPCPYLLELEL